LATLGGHEIHVITEDPTYSVNITQHPVESDIDLTDHVERKPTTMEITGKILGPVASDIRDQLVEAMMSGTRLDYIGRNAFRSALLARFSTTHDKDVANGYRFTATLQQVRVAQPSYAPLMNDPILLAEAKDTTNAGRQQLADQPPEGTEQQHEMRRGETLYSIAPKYGTSWQQLLALNPGIDPTRIQIGEVVRVA
jgi:LysM repeat protein